jgi:hypothetical protein
MEPRNMLVFTPFVNAVMAGKIGWLFASKPGKLLCCAIQADKSVSLAI